MTPCKPCTPFMILAALMLSSSVALSQQTPAPPPPTAAGQTAPAGQPATGQPAPVERRQPTGPGMRPGMRPPMRRGMSQEMQHGRPEIRSGMQHRSGRGNYHRAGMMHRESGFEGGFHGRPGGGMGMGGGFHIGPPGMWWKNPGIVERLTLTPVQTKKMDDIFQASRIQLIDLRANVEKQNVLLEPMLSANPPDTAKALAQIDKVAQARAELEKADAKMLLGIRGVLTPEQWTKLQARGGVDSAGQPGGPGRAGGPVGPGASGGMRGPGGGGTGRGGGDNLVAPDLEP